MVRDTFYATSAEEESQEESSSIDCVVEASINFGIPDDALKSGRASALMISEIVCVSWMKAMMRVTDNASFES